MEAIGKTGEVLRFLGTIPEHIRELVILAVARETSNQFEWQTHVPLALQAGISQGTVDTVAGGRRPKGLDAASETAIEFTCELMRNNGVSDATYADAVRAFSEAGVVELTALVGYFVMVCWIMNVAHTPGPAGTMTPYLSVPTSAQITEDNCQHAGLARCPFEITNFQVKDGRKVNVTNSGFGTVFGVVDGKSLRFVTMPASLHSALDTDDVQVSS